MSADKKEKSDLTAFQKKGPQPMNQTALDLIDTARAAAKAAAHACRDPQAREHFEYALALIGESWIAEDGQEARSPGQVITDVRSALDLFAAVAAMPLPTTPTHAPHP